MIFAFSGPDGVGKTTLLLHARDALEAKDYHVVVHEEFDFIFLGFLKRFTSSKSSRNFKAAHILSREKRSPKDFAIGLLYGTCVYLELLLEHVKFNVVKRRTILLRDRSALDFQISFQRMSMPSFTIWLMRCLPKPTIQFLVQVKPEVAIQRMRATREFTFDASYYKELHELYELRNSHTGAVEVNNESSVGADKVELFCTLRASLAFIKTIAISGLDGAGKTTTVTGLSALLDEMGVHYSHIHFYYDYLVVKLARLLRGRKEITEDKARHAHSIEAELKHAAQGKPTLWACFVLMDAALQYFFSRLTLSRVIIYDRFFPDYLVSFDFLKVRYNRKFLLRLFPRPDRYFLQVADYQILHERKPEHTLEFFKICHDRYAQLARDTRMIILNSGVHNEQQIIRELVEGL